MKEYCCASLWVRVSPLSRPADCRLRGTPGLSGVFSCAGGVVGFGKAQSGGGVASRSRCVGVTNSTSTDGVNLRHLGKAVFARCLHCKVTDFPLCAPFRGGGSPSPAHMQDGVGLRAASWSREASINVLLGILLKGRLVPSLTFVYSVGRVFILMWIHVYL